MKKIVMRYFPKVFIINSILVALLLKNASGQISAVRDTTGDYQAVKSAIEQSIGWAIDKDFDKMYQLWANNLFHFWLFSNSEVVGIEDFKKYSQGWKDPDFIGTRFEFRDLRIVFSQSGDVAWYSCYLDDCSSYKGKESCLENVFQTGVLENINEKWVHVLMHGSYPVDKIPERFIRKFYPDLIGNKKEQ